jgi:hypothetical protein
MVVTTMAPRPALLPEKAITPRNRRTAFPARTRRHPEPPKMPLESLLSSRSLSLPREPRVTELEHAPGLCCVIAIPSDLPSCAQPGVDVTTP